MTQNKLLSVADVQAATGLGYRQALLLVKSLDYIRIGMIYYISEKKLEKVMTQTSPVEIPSDL